MKTHLPRGVPFYRYRPSQMRQKTACGRTLHHPQAFPPEGAWPTCDTCLPLAAREVLERGPVVGTFPSRPGRGDFVFLTFPNPSSAQLDREGRLGVVITKTDRYLHVLYLDAGAPRRILVDTNTFRVVPPDDRVFACRGDIAEHLYHAYLRRDGLR